MSTERTDAGLHFERAATGTALPRWLSLNRHGSFLQLFAAIATELHTVRVLRATIPALHGSFSTRNRSRGLRASLPLWPFPTTAPSKPCNSGHIDKESAKEFILLLSV
jgi:hypothetical protein